MEAIGTVAIVALFIFGALIALGMIISFLGFIIEEGNGGCQTESRSSGNSFSVQIPENGQCRGYVEYGPTGSLPDYIQQAYAHPAYQIEHKKR